MLKADFPCEKLAGRYQEMLECFGVRVTDELGLSLVPAERRGRIRTRESIVFLSSKNAGPFNRRPARTPGIFTQNAAVNQQQQWG